METNGMNQRYGAETVESLPAVSRVTERTATNAEFGFNETTLVFLGSAVLLFSSVFWTANGRNLEKIDFIRDKARSFTTSQNR